GCVAGERLPGRGRAAVRVPAGRSARRVEPAVRGQPGDGVVGGAVVIGLFAIDAEQRKLAVELSTRLGRDTMVGDGPAHQAVHRMWTRLGSAVLLMPIGAAV